MARPESKYACDNPEYTTNILATYARANTLQIAAGSVWYSVMPDIAIAIGAKYGYGPIVTLATLAALSPQSNWDRNIRALEQACKDGHANNVWQTQSNRDTATRCLRGDIMALSGEKVTRFFLNLLGFYWLATIDSHAASIAVGYDIAGPKGPRHYAQIERAYQTAATILGIATSVLQAIVWLVRRDARGTVDTNTATGASAVPTLYDTLLASVADTTNNDVRAIMAALAATL